MQLFSGANYQCMEKRDNVAYFWERCMIPEMTVQLLPKFIFDVTDSKRDVKIKYFCKDDLYQELLLIKSLKSCGWRKVCKTYFQTTQNYPLQSIIIFYFT